MNIVLMLVGVLLVYFLLQYIYRKYWTKDLLVHIDFQTNHAVPGDTIYLQEQIINNKRLPLPYINIKFQLSKNFSFIEADGNSKISDQTYRNDVFSLLWYQKITRRIPLKCLKRGVYDIKQMDIVFNGIFMNETMVQHKIAGSQIFVYPEVINTGEMEVPFRQVMGNIEKKRYLLQDHFMFRGIRDYESYDSMRDINWKSTARTGSLMVNEFNESKSQKLSILLNLEPEGMLRQDRLSEASISIAAGLAQRFIEEGVEVSLLSNGCDIFHKQPIELSSGSGAMHLNALNTALATIDLSIEMQEFTKLLTIYKEKLVREGMEDQIYIIISANKRQNLIEEMTTFCHNPSESLWILPYHPGDDSSLVNCSIPSVQWEVGYDK